MNECKKTIVIIDDDEVFRRGLVRAFAKDNYRVLDFCGGEDMCSKLQENANDIILCDYKLPGPDGLEILKDVRRRGDATPFVLMTAHFTDEVNERAIRSGATATFEKPLNLESLKASCRKALSR